MIRGTTRRAAASFVILLAALLFYWLSLPPLDYTRFEHRSTVVAGRDGTALHIHLSADDKYRLLTATPDVSPKYIEALLTIEDQRFFRHAGVDVLALLRATWQWLSTGHIVSGGSTITMQVARLLEPKPRTLPSKLTEILRALELEWQHTKEDILTMYLTLVPMGSNVEGVRAGTSWIWGSGPEHLSLSQISALLAIPQSPTVRSPFRKTESLTQAQKRIALTLVENGIFPAADLDELTLPNNIEGPFAFPKQLWHASQRFKGTGDRITTTVDPRLQTDMESIAARYAHYISDNLNVAAMIMDADTGEILAHLGSLGIDSPSGFIDFTTTNRSPGSTLKPFVYGLAFDDGLIQPESVLFDVSTSFAGYRPDNFDDTYSGAVRAGDALIRSLNIPAVSVLDNLGPSNFIDAWQHANLKLHVSDPNNPILGIVLGAATTSMLDLVTAYSSLGSDGSVIEPTFTPRQQSTQRRFLLSEDTVNELRTILANVRDDQYRTSATEWRPHTTAFKTGTSVGFRDSWTVGVKGKYVIGTWVGTPTGNADQSNTGRNRALNIAFAIADALPDVDPIVPWQSTPLTQDEIPQQPLKIVYPSDGSRLVLFRQPSESRQLQITITGDARMTSIYVNDKETELSKDLAIPIPHDGFYDLEIRKGALSLQKTSFAVFTNR